MSVGNDGSIDREVDRSSRSNDSGGGLLPSKPISQRLRERYPQPQVKIAGPAQDDRDLIHAAADENERLRAALTSVQECISHQDFMKVRQIVAAALSGNLSASKRHSADCDCHDCHYAKKHPQIPHHALCGCWSCTRSAPETSREPVAYLVRMPDGWRYLASTLKDAEGTQRMRGGEIVPLFEGTMAAASVGCTCFEDEHGPDCEESGCCGQCKESQVETTLQPDATWADAALTLARQYDQGTGGTFEFDSTTLLRLLREARGLTLNGRGDGR